MVELEAAITAGSPAGTCNRFGHGNSSQVNKSSIGRGNASPYRFGIDGTESRSTYWSLRPDMPGLRAEKLVVGPSISDDLLEREIAGDQFVVHHGYGRMSVTTLSPARWNRFSYRQSGKDTVFLFEQGFSFSSPLVPVPPRRCRR